MKNTCNCGLAESLKKYATEDQINKFNWTITAVEEGYMQLDEMYSYIMDVFKE